MRTTNIIMNDAMKCLVEKLGVVETEIFISNLLKEPFNYTEWQREYFNDDNIDDFCDKALNWCKENPV